MVDVVYQWTEDGEAERCQLEYATADAEARCYHCDGLIEQGSAIARLFTRTGELYILHPACAQKGCNLPRQKEKGTHGGKQN